MQLSKIYSNQPNIFSDIDFREDGLNIVFAEIKDIDNQDNDTHNLGKSTLADLIDFMMLKERSSNFFLFKHLDLFKSFVFFLEVKVEGGTYLTIKRSVNNNSKITFKKTTTKQQSLRSLSDGEWDHVNVPIEKANKLLDSFLKLSAIRPWDYRKGISYFLRLQQDYNDVFQLSKFLGKHKDWKPYLFHILGFDGEIIKKKYEVEEKIEEKQQELEYIKKDYPGDIDSQDKIRGILAIAEQGIGEQEEKLDKFDFLFKENEVQKELIEEVGSRMADLNEQSYALNYEVDKIQKQLSDNTTFNLNSVRKIFEESSIYFGEQIKKDYEDLVGFNKKITTERKRFLQEQLKESLERIKILDLELKDLNTKRGQYTSFLQETNIFIKYKSVQKELIDSKTKIELLKKKLEISERISENSKLTKQLEKEKENLVDEITSVVNKGNDIYSSIRLKFSEIVKDIINEDAVISITVNKNNNIEFNAEIVDSSGVKTSQNKGTSYKRLLCAAFDLAVLIIHADRGFFHFAYHDGILEGLDNRKKTKLLQFIRENCFKYKIQHIITTIDSDWPVDRDGSRLTWDEDEVIKKLHDQGEKGRLFQMQEF